MRLSALFFVIALLLIAVESPTISLIVLQGLVILGFLLLAIMFQPKRRKR